jgi:hypothetical protein
LGSYHRRDNKKLGKPQNFSQNFFEQSTTYLEGAKKTWIGREKTSAMKISLRLLLQPRQITQKSF